MKKCVSILVGVLAVIVAAAAVLVALDRFRKQADEDPNDFGRLKKERLLHLLFQSSFKSLSPWQASALRPFWSRA